MSELYEMIGDIFGDVYSAEAIKQRAEEDKRMLEYYRQQAENQA